MRILGIAAVVGGLMLASILPGCGSEKGLAPAPEFPQLRIGMSISEAKRTLGERFHLPYWEVYADQGCGYFEIEDALIGGLVLDKHIATVHFSPEIEPRSGRVVGLGPEALRGLRPGQSFARAVELFGRPDGIGPAESSSGENVFWQLAEEGGTGTYLRILMNSYSQVVEEGIDTFEIGAAPGIFYPEGCA